MQYGATTSTQRVNKTKFWEQSKEMCPCIGLRCMIILWCYLHVLSLYIPCSWLHLYLLVNIKLFFLPLLSIPLLMVSLMQSGVG